MAGTINYGFARPEAADFYDVEVQNRNMERIDEELKNACEMAEAAEEGAAAAEERAKKHTDETAAGKVDKVAGKGLSANDYTAADKAKLDGIAAQANKTVIANNLATVAAGSALDAVQGKALSDKIVALQRIEMYVDIEGGNAEGIAVTATNGNTIVTAVTDRNGKCILYSSALGVYAITYSVELEGATIQVTANHYGLYSISGTMKALGVGYLMLYDEGNECVDMTGEWQYQYVNSASVDGIVHKENCINLKSQGGKRTDLITKQYIDMSEYAVVAAHVEIISGGLYIGVGDQYIGIPQRPLVSKVGRNVVAIDISTEIRNDIRLYLNTDAVNICDINFYAMALFKSDDWKTWLIKAGLNPASYATLDDVVNNISVMQILANSKAAVDYMIQHTGTIMRAVTGSIVAMTEIGKTDSNDPQSAMAKIIGNEHWRKFVLMSPNAIAALDTSNPITIPTMTSDMAPSGEVIASSVYNGYKSWMLFDKIVGVEDNYWAYNTSELPATCEYKFPNPIWAYKAEVAQRANSNADRLSKDFEIIASNSNNDFVSVGSGMLPNAPSGKVSLILKPTKKYRYYGIKVKTYYTQAYNASAVGELQIWGK